MKRHPDDITYRCVAYRGSQRCTHTEHQPATASEVWHHCPIVREWRQLRRADAAVIASARSLLGKV